MDRFHRQTRSVFDNRLFRRTEADFYLYSKSCILEYSHVVQRSIASLDLNLSEYSMYKKNEEFYNNIGGYEFFGMTGSKAIVTEESCRKSLAYNRRILYDFHLDVSHQLETSLRSTKDKKTKFFYSDKILVNKVDVDFEYEALSSYIIDAIEKTKQIEKLIRTVTKIAKNLKSVSNNGDILVKGLYSLCSQGITDSFLVMDFIFSMHLKVNSLIFFAIDVFRYVLFHANRTGFNLWQGASEDPIYKTSRYRMYAKTESLFQYHDAPVFFTTSYTEVKEKTIDFLGSRDLELPVTSGLMTEERHFLILTILCFFWRDRTNGLKVLQMIWRSIPDPFINMDELKLTLAIEPHPVTMGNLLRFIKAITGEDISEESGHKPRNLKHYCRTVIRRVLSRNHRLSTGIGELWKNRFPSSLYSYLRLET